MKIRYLGTAAAEGIPAMFCHCETCRRARMAGGRSIRTRAQTLIDGVLNIDFSPDAYMHELQYGLNYADIRYYFFTHVHEDHFSPNSFGYVRPGIGHVPEGHPGYDLFGSADILPDLEGLEEYDRMDCLRIHTLNPFETAQAGPYAVTPLPANHGTPHPYVYVISDGRKALLYLHDTGVLPDETMEWLLRSGLSFDLVSFDCTGGNHERLNYTSHMCFADIRRLRAVLSEHGLIRENTVLVLNHFSHNGLDVNWEDRDVYEKAGFVMAYDGMEIEI